ncbi:hypothetical protein BDZ91DRAFT_817616 [Kalaharituber pfeilii]|nr:hypothetical protein BDZ91DRAFT_817616 [Kalaharituber pfeilii]
MGALQGAGRPLRAARDACLAGSFASSFAAARGQGRRAGHRQKPANGSRRVWSPYDTLRRREGGRRVCLIGAARNMILYRNSRGSEDVPWSRPVHSVIVCVLEEKPTCFSADAFAHTGSLEACKTN